MRNESYIGLRDRLVDVFMSEKSRRYRAGFVDAVDENRGMMNVRMTNKIVYKDIIINMGVNGTYHGLRVMPMKGDFVLLGIDADNSLFHLTTLPFKYFQQIATGENINKNNLLMRKLKQGEIEILSGTESGLPGFSIVLLNDGSAEFTTKNHKLVYDIDDGCFYECDVLTYRMAKQRIKAGEVRRLNAEGAWEIKGVNGIPYTGVGDPLQELVLEVGRDVDSGGQDTGEPEIKIHLSDEILDDAGVPKVDGKKKKLQCEIEFKNGARITVNKDGLINIREANELTKPDKKAARNGDAVDMVIGSGYSDAEHPGQTTKALANVSEMVKLAPMIMSPTGPCTFIPTPGVIPKLTGEIVEGAEKVLVGDN